VSTLYIIGHGDSKAQGIGGTLDRLGLPTVVAPGYNGQAYTAAPTATLTGGDGAGGHLTAALLGAGVYPPGGGITLFPDATGTGYINQASPPTLTLSGGGSPTTVATFTVAYAGGYFTQIERQLIAAGYNVKFINIARSGSGIQDLPPGASWVSDAGVELVRRLGAANCLFYFSTGVNDSYSTTPLTPSQWAGYAASILSGYTALGVKVLADRTCDIVATNVPGLTSSQITAANALLTQFNATLDTLQTNNPTTFKIITDEQTLMHGHPEYFGNPTTNTGVHPNDAGNLAIANDAVPKLQSYINANFPASAPVLTTLFAMDSLTLLAQPTHAVYVLEGPMKLTYRSTTYTVPTGVSVNVPMSIYDLLRLDGFIA